jgi:hypothetical protein
MLSRRQRMLAWVALVALAAQAPVAAKLLPDDSWLFSVVVAALLSVLLIADDHGRRATQRSD